MRYQLLQLARNLRAGARLAFLLRVGRLEFRVGLRELVVLFLLSAVLDIGNDWVRYGPGAYFSLYGAGSELFAAAMLLGLSALLALAYRQHALALSLPVFVLSALAFVQLVRAVLDIAQRWWPVYARQIPDLDNVFTAWAIVVLIRTVAIALDRPPARRLLLAVIGGVVLSTPLWIGPFLMPLEPWWQQPSMQGGVDPRFPSAASEPVLAAQAQILDSALDELEDERPETTDLYFVAFGGFGGENVFLHDVTAAQKIMDERWDTVNRSVVLVNNPRTLLERPMATVTHLRETLNEFAGAMNTDEDVAIVYLASHGKPGEVVVSMPPLELSPLTPVMLRKLLDDAGITWRIVIVSACYGGSFIPALEEEHTMVIAAAQADRTSFGCGFRSESTYFGEALFEKGLATADSFPAAFEIARERIAERERAEHISPPSNPQIFVGAAMQAKLKELERGSNARRPSRMVCRACPGAIRVSARLTAGRTAAS